MEESRLIFRSGTLLIDLKAQVVTNKGVPVALRRKVFEVLRLLIVNRSRVVTKSELLNHAWSGSVSEDVLSGCIREIRRALSDDARNPHIIRTAFGDGYQFIAPLEEVATAPEPVAAAPAPPPHPQRWHWVVLGGIAAAIVVGLAVFVQLHRPERAAGPLAPQKEVAWWRFDETQGADILDSSGNGNGGKLVGGVRRVPGVLGSALEFDGKSGYLVGNGPGNNLPSGGIERTVSCWVRTSGLQEGDRNLFHWGTSASTPLRQNFHLFLRDGALAWGNGYGQGIVLSQAGLADGAWHHVAAVYDGPLKQSARLMLDGVQVGETSVPLLADTRLSMPWKIGTFMLGGRPFEGAIDDMRVYRSALSDARIDALRNCGSPLLRLQTPFGGVWFVPVQYSDLRVSQPDCVENGKEPFGMLQFARSGSLCQMADLRGMDMPASYGVAMTLRLGPVVTNTPNAAGPVVFAQPAGPDKASDAGYWIALSSDSTLSIRPLNARQKMLTLQHLPGFDPLREHRLAVTVRGLEVGVTLDGRNVLDWRAGSAQGHAAGIAFSSTTTPTETASQRASNIVLATN